MKLLAVGTLAVLSSSVNANWDKIQTLFVQLEEAAYNKTVADDPSQANDRGFTSIMLGFLADIQYYGCWCFLDESWDSGHGPVQDGLDQECKNLVNNYRCLVLDALDRGETCDPATTDYSQYNLFGGSGDVVGDCANANPTDQCFRDLCVADGTFTLNLFSLMFQQGGIAASQPPYDPTMTHSNNSENPGDFDPIDDCKIIQQGYDRSQKECCGTYPERFPFKIFGGEKACCGERTYSTLALQCCNDNILDINDPCN